MKLDIEAVGLQELINKLDEVSNDKIAEKVQKQALKPISQNIFNDIKKVTPVSKVRSIHGIDAEMIRSFSKSGYKGFDIGLTNQGGHGADYWNWVRGIWFQNWKTDEPNYGWFTRYKESNNEKWKNEARESVKIAVISYLKDVGFKE